MRNRACKVGGEDLKEKEKMKGERERGKLSRDGRKERESIRKINAVKGKKKECEELSTSNGK